MGFRNGSYAKVWEIVPVSNTSAKLRISISRKNKQTGEYEQDFSGFVMCIGTAAANKALSLKTGDRIKIGDCDVTTKYDADKKITYTNYKIFSFDEAGDDSGNKSSTESEMSVDDGEIDENNTRMPF